jgi:hypothetical protein
LQDEQALKSQKIDVCGRRKRGQSLKLSSLIIRITVVQGRDQSFVGSDAAVLSLNAPFRSSNGHFFPAQIRRAARTYDERNICQVDWARIQQFKIKEII